MECGEAHTRPKHRRRSGTVGRWLPVRFEQRADHPLPHVLAVQPLGLDGRNSNAIRKPFELDQQRLRRQRTLARFRRRDTDRLRECRPRRATHGALLAERLQQSIDRILLQELRRIGAAPRIVCDHVNELRMPARSKSAMPALAFAVMPLEYRSASRNVKALDLRRAVDWHRLLFPNMGTVSRILVLAREPIVAALVGMLVEMVGRTPVFAESDEAPSDALLRLRPLAVLLVDASIDAARSDLFFAIAARHGVRIAVFGDDRRARSLAEIAGHRRIPWFTIPPTLDELTVAINAAAGDRRVSRQPDRRAPSAVTAVDGTRILSDPEGTRWMVYDRRVATDRRAVSDSSTRVFISDAGELRELGVSATDLEVSAASLHGQLARATNQRS